MSRYDNVAYVGIGAVGFAKTERNPSFSGGAEARNVRRKTDLVFWLDSMLILAQISTAYFPCYFFSSRKKM
jgi:hypothetical protein